MIEVALVWYLFATSWDGGMVLVPGKHQNVEQCHIAGRAMFTEAEKARANLEKRFSGVRYFGYFCAPSPKEQP